MLQRIPFPQTLLSLLLLLLCASYGSCDPLVTFQVAQPPPFPQTAESLQCTVLILQRTFASSIGDPEVVQFTPPTECSIPDNWAGISLKFNVTSSGTQNSRLGIFTFQHVEIWRMWTPMPVEGDGIVLTYIKDVTRFIPLFSESGTFVLQLDNVVQSELDGEYATTVEATFFGSSGHFPPAQRADLIVPLTTIADNASDAASVPPEFSIDVILPRNAVAVFAELQASGNGPEMNWYNKVPNDFLGYFPGTASGTTIGDGPFREVRVQVDGQIAGVAFPYPVITPGGILPVAWRPITSYGAIDLPTYHLDLTPFIPVLTDGELHTITLDVASAELTDHQINQNWFLSGLLQVKLDSSNEPTTGNITLYEASDFATVLDASVDASGVDRVNIVINASRSVHIEAEIIAGSGERFEVVFTQDLEYGNVLNYLHNFTTQNVFQISSGETLSKHNGEIALQDTFTYALIVDFTTSPDGSDQEVEVDQSFDRELRPAPFILGTTIVEHQQAGGLEHFDSTGGTGINGTSINTFNYVDTESNTYTRQVNASSEVITFDNQGGTLAPTGAP